MAFFVAALIFQSTLSVRRATEQSTNDAVRGYISIHALRKESDGRYRVRELYDGISIHALRKESDEAVI